MVAGAVTVAAMRRRPLLLASVVLSLVAVGCGDDGDGGGEPEVVGTTVPDAAEAEIVATDFAFDPARFEVTAGAPVNVTLRVERGGHNLRFEGTDVQFPIVEEGDAAVATLLVDEPGTYRMLCTVPGHEAAGMVAEYVVTG